jgi:hypothetical protein
MKHVGEPCAGEPHARFDGGWLETGAHRTAPAAYPVTAADQLHQPAGLMKMVEGDVRYKSCQT